MSAPSSITTTFVDSLVPNIRIPDYQRDFAWKNPKMNQLWKDLLAHLMKGSQKNHKSGYYLGAVVLDRYENHTYLVDGQQRFTTMYLISCAVRDALIATGYTKQAHEIHHNVVVDTHRLDEGKVANRYQLLDIPSNDERSSEYQLSPYRKPLVNIRTGLLVDDEARSGFKDSHVAIKGGKAQWSVRKGEKWYFKLWDDKKKTYVGSIYRVTEDDNNHLKFGTNTPRNIVLDLSFNNGSSDMMDVFRSDLEIVLVSNVKWAGYNCVETQGLNKRPPLHILTTSDEKRDMNKSEKCDLFSKRNREFYLRVRNDAEHFIRGEKLFKPAGGLKKTQKSTTLNISRYSPGGEIGQSSRAPKENEILEFIERNESAGWPTKDQLVELIEGDESSFVEFKQGFKIKRTNPKTGKLESTKMMMEMAVKTVAGFLNTTGGLLLVGVRSDKKIVGINDEPYISDGKWSDDKAIQTFSSTIRKYISPTASKFVDYRVYNIGHEKVMCVKVEKYPSTFGTVEVKISTKWDSDTGARLSPAKKEYFTKDAVSVLKTEGEDEEELKNVAQYLSSALGEKYKKGNDAEIRHEFRVSEFSGIVPWRETSSIQTKLPSVTGEILTKNDIPPHAECSISYLEPGKRWAEYDWLDREKKRATQIRDLVKHTCFSKVIFANDSLAAIDHFMLTNNPEKFEPLNAYDLTSSFTQKLLEIVEDEKELNEDQKEIKEKWYDIRYQLYIDSNKESKTINKFFYDYLIAELLTKKGTQRYGEKDTWNGIEEEFKNRTNEDGSFDYKSMAKLYAEMRDYMASWLRAINDNSPYWNEKPYNQASCRDERNYLQAIRTAGVLQHIPVYIALVKAVEDQNADRSVIKDFLKNFNYMTLRFRTLPQLLGPEYACGFEWKVVYGKILSKDGWIRRIKKADLKDEAGREMIASMPLELMPDSETVNDLYPWTLDHEEWGHINKDGTLSGKLIKHVLYSAERALESIGGSTQSPQMTRLHGVGVKVQTEHIIPRAPRLLGGKWYEDGETTDYHSKFVFALGNHCLIEDSRNSSVRNKPPLEKASNFLGSDFKLAKIVGQEIIDSGTWDKAEIMRNSTRIMNSLVRFYS